MYEITKVKRFVFFIFFDFLLFLFSFYLSYLLRFSFDIPNEFYMGLVFGFLFLTAFKFLFFWLFKIYKIPWRFFGLSEARIIVLCHILSLICFMISNSSFDILSPFPRSVVLIDAFVSCFLIGAFRISKRMLLDFSNKKGNPCIIVGATSKGLALMKSLVYMDFYVLGVFDNKKEFIGTYCGGLIVQNLEKIPSFVKTQNIKSALVALDDTNLKEIFDYLSSLGIRDIKIFSKEENFKIKDICIEDLLARKPKDLNLDIIKSFISNKKILITGAGGSIGSELSKQCFNYGAKQLIMLDNSEYNLYKIGEEIPNAVKILLDINNKKRLKDIVNKFNPDIVLHAAAYKHISLCEENPLSAIENNILATKKIVDVCNELKISKLVVISSDKAVRPTSIMGATKRVCEIYALSSNGDCEIACVRFGNVLNSSGSVVPKFKKLIEENKPLSVTHEKVTRYFMLNKEACALVLQAASLAKGGELFVLDMGNPIFIKDLAKKMLLLSNKEHLGIKFVGLKKGEKLYEELLIDKNDIKTKYDSIFVAKSTLIDIEKLNSDIEILLKDPSHIVENLKKIVPEFNHNNCS